METKLDQLTEGKIGSTGWQEELVGWLVLERSETTIAAYLQDLRVFTRWYRETNGQEFTLQDLTAFDLRAWRKHCVVNGDVAPATWNRRLASLRVIAQWGQEAGYLGYDPTKDIQRMPESDQGAHYPSKLEVKRLVRHLETEIHRAQTVYGRWQAVRDQAMVALMLYAGLREGEVSALEIRDLVIGERKGRVIIRHGKGNKRREIPLNAEARMAVSMWLELRQADDLNDLVFVGKRFGQLGTGGIQDRVSDIGKQIGLEITPHQLRHAFCKELDRQGVSPRTRQKLMGHARLETTLRYGEPGWEDFEEAVEKI